MRILSSITLVLLLASPLAAQTGQSSADVVGPGLSTGESNFGAATADRTGGVQNQTIGTLRNGSRFERGARRGGQFVGSDRRDQQTFVGAVQGATNPAGVSSVTGVTTSTGPNAASVNQVRQPSAAAAAYDPTLVVAFDVPQSVPHCVEQEVNCRLAQLSGLEACQVSVQVVGQTAVVQGSVVTADQRRCVELYLQMEPGITSVDNRLSVQDAVGLQVPPSEFESQQSAFPEVGTPRDRANRFEQSPFDRPLTELFSAPSGN